MYFEDDLVYIFKCYWNVIQIQTAADAIVTALFVMFTCVFQ